MSTQQALALPLPAASNTVVINARCSLRIEADQRVIVVGGLPVHHYRAEDAGAEAYAMVFLVESGFAQQMDVARAFGRSVRTVRRHQARYVQGGMAALGREEGWRRLFYSSRRHLPVKLRALVDFLRKESKDAAHVIDGRPVCFPVVAAAHRRRSEPSAGGEQRNTNDLTRTGEVIPIRHRPAPPPPDNALAMAPGG